MTVSAYALGDKFIFRVVKSLTTNPDDQWVNTYEFKAQQTGTEAELLQLGVKLVDFEKLMHHDVVQFVRLIISTWEPDSVPYDPAAFISSSLSGNGGIGSSTTLMALNTTLSVARVAAFGRQGHIFYRGFLDEEQVQAPAGKNVLVDRTEINDDMQTHLTTSELDTYLGMFAEQFQMVMISADGDQVRPVVGLIAQGVSSVPTDHKWFNRTRITVP